MHFYDRSPTRIQLHIDKPYLKKKNLTFNIEYLKTKFEVSEKPKDDYPIKIHSADNLDFLADFLFKLYN